MKHERVVAAFFATLLLLPSSSALAQNGNTQAVSTTDQKVRPTVSESNLPADPGASAATPGTLREVAQRRGAPPFPRQMGRPGRGYAGYPSRPSPWLGEDHPGHALIGAFIGGTLGATVGYNAHPPGERGPNVGGSILLGGIGAVIGGVIGNSIGGSHFHRFHHGSWPDEDEMGARSKAPEAQQTASVKPTPTQQSGKGASPSAQSPATP